jgi:hypothetical protein
VTAAGLNDGRFLCRSGKKPGDFVLCVVYKGKPTHHLMTKGEDGNYIINKKSYGPFTKPNLLIKHLGKEGLKGWPVPLNKPVYVGAGGSSGSDVKAVAAKAAAAAAKAKAIEEATMEKAAEKAAAEVSTESSESKPDPSPETEPEPEQQPGPADTEPEAELPFPAAAGETSTDPALKLQESARAAADAAYIEVAQKKAELEALRSQALLPGSDQSFRLNGAHPGEESSTDSVTPNLARLVIKMGQRLSELEMQTQQLSQIIQSLMDHAQRISA